MPRIIFCIDPQYKQSAYHKQQNNSPIIIYLSSSSRISLSQTLILLMQGILPNNQFSRWRRSLGGSTLINRFASAYYARLRIIPDFIFEHTLHLNRLFANIYHSYSKNRQMSAMLHCWFRAIISFHKFSLSVSSLRHRTLLSYTVHGRRSVKFRPSVSVLFSGFRWTTAYRYRTL